MNINRTVARFAAAAALAAALGVASAPGATASGLAGTGVGRHPAISDKSAKTAGTAASGRPGDDGGWHGDGLSLNAADNKKVDTFLVRARQAERSISPEVRTVARVSAATLVGFDHRLKSPDSLKRKVATSMKGAPRDDRGPGPRQGERLRPLHPPVARRPVHQGRRRRLRDDRGMGGNDSVKWSNTWDRKKGYKGINSAWRDAWFGHVFEIQFHTPASKWAQEETHKLYEEQRLPSTTPERAKELQAQQDAIFRQGARARGR
ncbi:hypothetical protein GCM10020000_72720 [Streptomyces olivoverticillatus]